MYKLQFKELIRLDDRSEYDRQYNALKDSWDPTFANYYQKFIHSKIDLSGWWSAKACGWRGFTDLSIWTSNQAEAANRQYRERLEFRSATIVEAIRHFDDWQRSTLNELARAFMGLGNYMVVEKFRREDDLVEAQKLLERVQGATIRDQMAGEGVRDDYIPTSQGEGARSSVSVNLMDSFNLAEVEEELEELSRTGINMEVVEGSSHDGEVVEGSRQDQEVVKGSRQDQEVVKGSSQEQEVVEGSRQEQEVVEGKSQKGQEVVESRNQKDHEGVEQEVLEGCSEQEEEMDLDIVEVEKSIEGEHANLKLLRPHNEVNYMEEEDDDEQAAIDIILGTEEEDEFVPESDDEDAEEYQNVEIPIYEEEQVRKSMVFEDNTEICRNMEIYFLYLGPIGT